VVRVLACELPTRASRNGKGNPLPLPLIIGVDMSCKDMADFVFLNTSVRLLIEQIQLVVKHALFGFVFVGRKNL